MGVGDSSVRLATTAMGTWFDVLVGGTDPVRSRSAAEAAIEVIEDTHRRFSRFEVGSFVSHLRRAAPQSVAVDWDTFELFQDALIVRNESGGAFDIEVGRLPDSPSGIFADPERLTIGLKSSGVNLDFGAIGKGHAIDLAGRVLREAGVTEAFLQGGTSSGFGIGAPSGEAWRIALGTERGAPVVELRDRAFSVSSTADRRHITDPRTGRPIDGIRRVAVIGSSARLADAWSTALIVLGSRTRGPGSPWTVWMDRDAGGWQELVFQSPAPSP